ncbi:hypothetical protein [Archaeoglobus neptunius]|nr:hypothetical protein [Archaeoglobus neptunius]
MRIEIKENLVERLKDYRAKAEKDILKEFIEERRQDACRLKGLLKI